MPVTISVGCLKTAGTVVGVEDDLTAPVSSADMGCGKLWLDFKLWCWAWTLGGLAMRSFRAIGSGSAPSVPVFVSCKCDDFGGQGSLRPCRMDFKPRVKPGKLITYRKPQSSRHLSDYELFSDWCAGLCMPVLCVVICSLKGCGNAMSVGASVGYAAACAGQGYSAELLVPNPWSQVQDCYGSDGGIP